jgi:di- and tripeptidase
MDEQDEGVITLAVKDSTTLYAGLQGGSIRIFDLLTLTVIRVLAVGEADILTIVTTEDGCLATSADGMLYKYSQSFMLQVNLRAHQGLALSCISSRDGTIAYTGGNDGTLRIWQFPTLPSASPTRSEALQGERGFPSLSQPEC